MHTVVLLAHALNLAERSGYVVRQEWVDCNGGGACEFRGRKFLFVDLSSAPADQLDKVLQVLRREPGIQEHAMPRELCAALGVRKIA